MRRLEQLEESKSGRKENHVEIRGEQKPQKKIKPEVGSRTGEGRGLHQQGASGSAKLEKCRAKKACRREAQPKEGREPHGGQRAGDSEESPAREWNMRGPPETSRT